MGLTVGRKGHAAVTVAPESTAQAVGSGDLPVYATPCMAALMEAAACAAIADTMDADKTSVGTALHISHVSATPIGQEVSAEAEITAIDGKVITFRIAAYDAAGLIGEGMHQRSIVTRQRFLDRVQHKY